jgi:hypothetical protein
LGQLFGDFPAREHNFFWKKEDDHVSNVKEQLVMQAKRQE